MNMNLNWNERTPLEKFLFILQCVGCVILVISLLPMITGKTQERNNDLFYLFIGFEGILESIVQWNRNRKMAILYLLASIIVLGISAATFLL